jgi:hypothetical protein
VEFKEVQKRAGFARHTFKTDVELKLHMAGIKVLSEEESLETPGMPYLYVNLNPIHQRSNETAAVSISIELKQTVLLERDPSLRVYGATTWSAAWAGWHDLPFIREKVKDLTDQFINAWLSVNPKKGLESAK